MRGLISENNVSNFWLERGLFVQRIFLKSLVVSHRLLSGCTPSLLICSWNSALCVCQLLSLSEGFSEPSFFVMAEDLIWCSAQLPHPCEPGVRVRMWWQEERKTEVKGDQRPPSLYDHTGGFRRKPPAWQSRMVVVLRQRRASQQEPRCHTVGFFMLAAPSGPG